MGKVIGLGWIAGKIDGITVDASLPCNRTNFTALASRKIEYLVAHYTGNAKDTAWANAHWYHEATGVGASAHFFVDENAICQSVGLKDRAGHCGTTKTYYHSSCRNNNSIGIEMCCSGSYKISEKTKRHAAYLFAHLCRMLDISASQVDTFVVRHYDVTHKLCPAQMAGPGNAEWTAFKQMIRDILTTGAINGSQAAVTTGATETRTLPALPFLVMVTASKLNVRSGPGTTYALSAAPICRDEVYTIIDTSPNGWGKLKSGAGWICLDYAEIGTTVRQAAVVEMGTSTTVTEALPDVSVREGVCLVLVTTDALNVRVGPGTGYGISREVPSVHKGEKYTIVETQGNWGRLKSGAGWICLDYTRRV